MKVYETCPIFENDIFCLRYTTQKDAENLLKAYSDENAVPFFNIDNCHGDDFHYTTLERMKKAIDFWDFSYRQKQFVRWTIVDKCRKNAIGTIELFNRKSTDYFNNCGILRLDLRSDYEKKQIICGILSMIVHPAFEMFECEKLATKAIPAAKERISALAQLGFVSVDKKLIGHDGTQYGDYYILT